MNLDGLAFAAEEKHGLIDVLVSSAAIALPQLLEE